MIFEWDTDKSTLNKLKHKISFPEAQAIFFDEDAIIIPGNPGREVRFVRIGSALGKIWAAAYTERDGKTRVISVRPARRNERALYG